MTGDIINLRSARKRRNRVDKERQAAENRQTYGQTKSERMERKAELDRKAKTLDGHLRVHKESAATEKPDISGAAPVTIRVEKNSDKNQPQ